MEWLNEKPDLEAWIREPEHWQAILKILGKQRVAVTVWDEEKTVLMLTPDIDTEGALPDIAALVCRNNQIRLFTGFLATGTKEKPMIEYDPAVANSHLLARITHRKKKGETPCQ